GRPVHHRDLRGIDKLARRDRQFHRRAIEPGEVRAVGRAVAHLGQVPADQAGQQAAALVQVADDLVQPYFAVPVRGDVGGDAGIARPVRGEETHLLPALPVGLAGEDDLRALEAGQVPALRGGGGGQGVRRGRVRRRRV